MAPGFKTTAYSVFVFLMFWLGIRFLLPLLLPFLLGGALALTAEPLVRFLCRRLHLPRSVGAGIGVSAAFVSIALLGLMVCAFLFRELGILAGILPDLADTAHSGIQLLRDRLMELSSRSPQSIRPLLEQNVSTFFSGGTAVLNRGLQYMLGLAGNLLKYLPDSALGFGTAVISGFMISAKLPVIRKWLLRRLSRERLQPILAAFRRIRTAVGCWLLAQLKLAGVTLLILTLGLMLLRIPHAPLWAAGITLVDAFPVLGTGTVLLPWALICFLQQDGARAIGLLGIYAVISITRSVLEPRLVGRELGLDPLVTLMALYAGYKLWGIGGMLLAPLLTVTAIQLFPKKPAES